MDEPALEIPETTEQTENSLVIASNVISTYDMIEDLATTDKIIGEAGKIILPSAVNIIYKDILYTDGDGVEIELDFGELGNSEPYGVLCLDGVYRAGKMLLKMDKPYSLSGSKIVGFSSKDEPLYTGDGASMVSFTGTMAFERFSNQLVNIETDGFTGELENEPFTVTFNLQADKKEDGGDGIVNDIIHYSGAMQINSNTDILSINVRDALKKQYSEDCMENIVTGVLDITMDNSLSEISVDFDPNKDQECDRLVDITFNGKTVQYHY